MLKRLHLEPWTASGGGKALTEEEKFMKLNVRLLSIVPLSIRIQFLFPLATREAEGGSLRVKRFNGTCKEKGNEKVEAGGSDL